LGCRDDQCRSSNSGSPNHFDSLVRAWVVRVGIRTNVCGCGRDADDILDACLQGVDEELTLLGEMCEMRRRLSLYLAHGAKSGRSRPSSPCELDARYVCQCFCRWFAGIPSKGDDAVRGQSCASEQLGRFLYDTAADFQLRRP
jgi:hypothetical protein